MGYFLPLRGAPCAERNESMSLKSDFEGCEHGSQFSNATKQGRWPRLSKVVQTENTQKPYKTGTLANLSKVFPVSPLMK